MSIPLEIYHRLPPAARSLVASLRGYYLNWWRYDKQTESLVEEALERDYWNESQWNDWNSAKLSYLLNRAVKTVPFYRDLWSERRRRGDNRSWEYLENWPILEKEQLRNNAASFVADDRSISKMFREHTSGTTGTSLDLWMSEQTVKQWYALFEARCRRWHGFSRYDRWGIFGGQLVASVKQNKPPFWVWNAASNQLYLSTYHISAESSKFYLDALEKYKVKYVLGYPSAIYSLAQHAIKLKTRSPHINVVITNAEPLFDHQRNVIAQAFNCPVRESYGMAEIVAAASECDHNLLHQWPDVGMIETITNSGSDSSEFLCTGLINLDMPLIRYRVGDSGGFSVKKCKCGRGLPVLASIHGRSDDLLYTTGGRQIGRMDPIFKKNIPIIEAQIIQESLKSLRVKYVPADNFHNGVEDDLTSRIRERLGDINIVFEQVAMIPRTERGKFRGVICRISKSERAQVENLM